ncbi:MAG: PBP1A family penicillin-binding protein [Oscillospiraceae bacterium]|nr:PBP1A family penicillin-binding protein [Oscillospiraceae bacterium]
MAKGGHKFNWETPQKKNHPVLHTVLRVIGTLFLVGAVAFSIFCVYFFGWVKSDLSQQSYLKLEDYSLDQTSVIYYQDSKTGEWKELQKLYATENRVWTDYENIPNNLVFACVSIEDKRFFEHSGVDWLRTLKACGSMFIGNSSYGGSTITQQLVKNLTKEDQVTVRRKLTEIYRALHLEDDYEKSDIMEMYLNTIYLGEGCYGVESAALQYFGKDVWDLSLAECASLIGITNNPSKYDPYLYPENNRDRQLTILSEMLKQGYISETDYDTAVAEEMDFHSASSSVYDNQYGYYSYFVDQVVRDVVADLMEQTGYSYEVCSDMLTSGGYSIYCTIDLDVQTELETVFEDKNSLPTTESSQQLEGGMVIIDNESGDIVALVGGTGEKTGSLTFNRATQSQLQPGSVLKPITVYAPALEAGLITPVTVMDDTPLTFTDEAAWPKNSDGIYRGLVNMTTAVSLSLNTVAVKLVNELGPQACYDFATEKMGITGLVASRGQYTDLTLWGMGLGSLTDGVTIRSLAQAYAAFYNHGVYREGRTYTKVEDSSGNVILDNEQETHQAVSEKNAWYLTSMMQATVTSGTGTAASLGSMPVAGKTGTTSDNFDRWFAGYTPYYTAVTWTGYDTPETIVTTDGSGNPSITLWQKVMSSIHSDLTVQDFWKLGNVVECSVCQDSGMLATDACRSDPRGDRTVTAYLALEDVPTEYCTNHKMVDICGVSNHVATEYCEQQAAGSIYQVGMLNVSRFFPIEGIVVQDQQYNYIGEVPAGYVAAESAVPDPLNLECYVHVEIVNVKTEEDLIKEALEKQRAEAEESAAENTGSNGE